MSVISMHPTQVSEHKGSKTLSIPRGWVILALALASWAVVGTGFWAVTSSWAAVTRSIGI